MAEGIRGPGHGADLPRGGGGGRRHVVRKMRLGTLDASLLSAAGVADIDRSIFALELPMAYASYEELDFVLERMEPTIEKLYADKGFIVLGWADAGWVRFFSKSPVRTPDDLKGLKLLTWAGDDPAVELWKAAGFNPVPLPSTEISTAIQTGLVTAIPTTPQAALLLQWYTHARYMCDVRWAVLLGGIVITKATWERVPAAARPAMLKSAHESGPHAGSADARGGGRQHRRDGAARAHRRPRRRRRARSLASRGRGRVSEGCAAAFVPAAAFDEALKIRDEYRESRADKAVH